MKRNKSFINFIIAISIATVLLVTVTSKTIKVSAVAVGPLADPVYDTEIIAFKDYVETNLDASQLDIMFFLIGGLAVAQMGAQDAMLISPYPNEESVKEWIINCGIQLYNSVIGLVPAGNYYMGIPSISTGGQKGIPRQVIKALVAQMMGDAVVAINYPDLDTFLEENPDKLLLPFNADLQLGVNAIFGLNGGLYDWQSKRESFKQTNFVWRNDNIGAFENAYNSIVSTFTNPSLANFRDYYNTIVDLNNISNFNTLFINSVNGDYYVCDEFGNRGSNELTCPIVYCTMRSGQINAVNQYNTYWNYLFANRNIALNNFSTLSEAVQTIFNSPPFSNSDVRFKFDNLVKFVYYGTSWENRQLLTINSDLSILETTVPYYQQVQTDYLFDLRGLMGNLVNYVYLNKIWDNIYDLVDNLVVPDRVNVSVDLTPITDLLAPPLPVNLNDIDLYTDNDYLREIKDRSTKFGETLGEYFVFWHNSDPMTVYVIFGSVIVILIGAFIGKWGHS